MCTLAFAWGVFDGLAVAATREEAYGRPSSPPAYRDWERRVLCPRDEEAGGTWIGVNDAGLFVALTNRPADTEGERSRGLLVRDALAAPDAATARETVERELDERPYSGFNLVLADTRGASPDCVLLTYDGDPRVHELAPGVHVVVNEGFDSGTGKSARIRAALESVDADDADAWRRLASERLADHDLGACIHGERGGTVSASLLTVGERVVYEFAPGPPCETAFERVEGHF
jgi:uncharacterized protein with NRDE domain